MVVIRLSRGGAKRRPFYNIIVNDRRKARDARSVERIGYFNPIAAGKEVRLLIDTDRLNYWLSQGAQASDRVKQLVRDNAAAQAETAAGEAQK